MNSFIFWVIAASVVVVLAGPVMAMLVQATKPMDRKPEDPAATDAATPLDADPRLAAGNPCESRFQRLLLLNELLAEFEVDPSLREQVIQPIYPTLLPKE